MNPKPAALSETAAALLQKLAEKTGMSPTEVLDAALDAYRQQLELDDADAKLRADPEAWAEYQADQKERDDPPDDASSEPASRAP